MKVLVTGVAGFIGSQVTKRLLGRGDEVIGVDNFNDYYDVALKCARVAEFENHPGYLHIVGDLSERAFVEAAFAQHRPDRVIHLAAQPGVRYASINPHAYVQSNIVAFLHVLEGCRLWGADHLVFASTSSVYGANRAMPYSEHASTEHPLTLYAATKKADELMAHSYAHLYGIPCTGLRFFTVYGPWGRPDMAPVLFARAICDGEPIKIFNNGHHKRSFTYIEDIVEGIVRVVDMVATPNPAWDPLKPDPATSNAPYRIYNIGHRRPVELMNFVELLEEHLGRKATIEMLPLQAGDVPDTEADTTELNDAVGYTPHVAIEEGVRRFARWFLDYYKQQQRSH